MSVDRALAASQDEAAEDVEAPVRRMGRFVVERTLGEGAMGTVLEAYDGTLDRKVALKILRRGTDPQAQSRLLREAQALARLSHPNVVQVHEVGELDGQMFIAMELVDGQTLRQWQSEPRPWPEVLGLYAQVGQGLAAAHAEGLIHRDFKPANCIVDDKGRARVLDFGLARQVALSTQVELDSEPDAVGAAEGEDGDAEDGDAEDGAAGRTSGEPTAPSSKRRTSATRSGGSRNALAVDLTRTGAVLGTLAYMAPEQLMGRAADARCDQFAFCVAMYEALYGVRPFGGRTPMALFYAINQGELAPTPTRRGLPPVPKWLRTIVLRGLRSSPSQRYVDMQALLDELERVPRRRRVIRGGALVTGVGVLAVAGMVAWPEPSPCEGVAEAEVPGWTPQAQQVAREGLLATGLAFAEPVAQRVQEGLDAHAAAWTQVRTRACQAAHETRTTDLRTYDLQLACLDGGTRRMAALVEQLGKADGKTLAQAVSAMQALPAPPVGLAGERRHARAAAVPDHLAELDAKVRVGLDGAWAIYQAGHTAEGLEAIEPLVAEAEPLGDDSATRAEVLLLRGDLRREAHLNPSARLDLMAAMETAERARDVELQIDVLQALVMLEGSNRDRSAGEAWLTTARGKLAALDDPTARALKLRFAETVLDERTEHYDRGLELVEEVVAGYRQRESTESAMLARSRRLKALLLVNLGRPDEALEEYRAARALAESIGAYRQVAALFHEVAFLELQRGDLESARRDFERAVELISSILGEGVPTVLRARIALTQTLVLSGDQEAALAEAASIREALERAPGVDPALRGDVMNMSGALSQGAGQCEAALDFFARAEEAFTSMPEPDHLELAMTSSNRADCLRELGRLDEALAGYQRAMTTLGERTKDDDPLWVHPLLGMGQLHLERGAPTDAIAVLERALRIQTAERTMPNEELLAWVRWVLGRALVESGQGVARGLGLIDDARRGFASIEFTEPIAEIDQWQAACGDACTPPTTDSDD